MFGRCIGLSLFILGLLACVIGPEPRLLYMWITVGGVALYCYSVVESAYPRR